MGKTEIDRQKKKVKVSGVMANEGMQTKEKRIKVIWDEERY